jgi:hypothetical protein
MTSAMLAIWSDVTPEQETDYLHWLTREHTAERVGIPGFEAVRVFRADLPEVCRYLILYDLTTPSVLTSPAYLARLNAPTPWSQRIMPTLRNFARGGGWVRTVRGTGSGAYLLPLRLKRPDRRSGTPAGEPWWRRSRSAPHACWRLTRRAPTCRRARRRCVVGTGASPAFF